MATTAVPSAIERRGTVAACVSVALWGAGNVIVKQIHMSGAGVAFNRLWLAALLFTVYYYARGGRLSWRTLRIAAPGGVAFGLDVVLFFTAVKHTSVADASIINALQPALVFVVAGRLFGERLRWSTVGWTTVAIGGAALSVFAASASSGRSTSGDLIAIAALVMWSWYFVASKQARAELGALEYQLAMTLVAAVVVSPIALVEAHQVVIHDGGTAGWIVVMVMVPGMGHLIMNWAHAHAPITLTSLLTLGIPVVAAIGAALTLSEPISVGEGVGMAIVVLALSAVLLRTGPDEPAELTTPDTA